MCFVRVHHKALQPRNCRPNSALDGIMIEPQLNSPLTAAFVLAWKRPLTKSRRIMIGSSFQFQVIQRKQQKTNNAQHYTSFQRAFEPPSILAPWPPSSDSQPPLRPLPASGFPRRRVHPPRVNPRGVQLGNGEASGERM